MKKVKFLLLLIVALPIFSLSANDILVDNSYNTYLGFSYKQNWVTAKGQWQALFIEPKPGFDFYLGWRFHPFFATEVGYAWTANKPGTFVVPNNTTLLGIHNTSNTSITMQSKLRFKTGYVDLQLFLPFTLLTEITPEVIVSAGVSSMKPSIKIYPSPITPATLPFTSEFSFIEGRSKAVFRLGAGIQMLLIENVGVRAIWHFERTSVLRARNSEVTENPNTRELFKDAQTLGVGLFVKF